MDSKTAKANHSRSEYRNRKICLKLVLVEDLLQRYQQVACGSDRPQNYIYPHGEIEKNK